MIPREIWGCPRLISWLHQGAPFDHQHVLGCLAYQGPSPSGLGGFTRSPNFQVEVPGLLDINGLLCTAASSHSVQVSAPNVNTWTGNQAKALHGETRPANFKTVTRDAETTTVDTGWILSSACNSFIILRWVNVLSAHMSGFRSLHSGLSVFIAAVSCISLRFRWTIWFPSSKMARDGPLRACSVNATGADWLCRRTLPGIRWTCWKAMEKFGEINWRGTQAPKHCWSLKSHNKNAWNKSSQNLMVNWLNYG